MLYDAAQVARAQLALRRKLGLPDETFSAEDVISMLGDEIEQMRAAGRKDLEIARILRDAGILADETDVAAYRPNAYRPAKASSAR